MSVVLGIVEGLTEFLLVSSRVTKCAKLDEREFVAPKQKEP
jgi:hypothetical protein